jgi:hypothetical protein
METIKDNNSKTSITRHFLYVSISIFMIALIVVFTMTTISMNNYIKRSETIKQQYVSLNESANKVLQKPVSLISEIIFGLTFKSLGGAAIISQSEADSLINTSLRNVKQNSEQLAILLEAILASDEFPNYQRNLMKAKLSEADAALGSIRTQLRVYYGENGTYPYSRERTYVMGARWNDIRPGELTGKYFSDRSFTYYCRDGDYFTITCAAGDVLESDRTLNSRGVLAGGIE